MGRKSTLLPSLSLKVNRDKSTVDRPWKRKFLGVSFFRRKGEVQVRRIAGLNEKLRGWVDYFALADTPSTFERLAEWIRRRLRMCLWKQWKRHATRVRELRKLGLKEKAAREIAATRNGYWRTACTPQLHQALDNAFWAAQGLIDVVQR